MSELNDIKSKPEAKRVLKGVHFDFTGAEITYTAGLGACSGHNDMVLAKSVDSAADLTEEQTNLLAKIGKEFTPLKKSLDGNDEVSTTSVTKTQNQEGNNMSVELQKQLDDQAALITKMQRDNDVLLTTQEVKLFEFDVEIEKELVEAMVDGACSAPVLKALQALKDAKPAVVEVEKQNPVAKALEGEEGYSAEAEEEVKVVKSLIEELEDRMKAKQIEKEAK